MKKSLFFLFFIPVCICAQAIQTEFGKNRIQYHDDFERWWKYETENFIIHYYGKGRNLGQFISQTVEEDYKEIQSLVEHRFNEKIEIITYLDQTDLNQSNIGTSEIFENSLNKTPIIGNKIFVYFDGDHNRLRQQVRRGLANAFVNAMFTKNSIQDVIQESTSLGLTEWFAQGLVEYAASGWDIKAYEEFTNYWNLSKPDYTKFKRFAADHPKICGQSFWNFLAENYGKSNITNLLYLIRINRDIEQNIEFLYDTSFKTLIEEWKQYYSNSIYQIDETAKFDTFDEIHLKLKKESRISRIDLSPDGKLAAIVRNDIGKARVYLLNLETQDYKQIFKHGYRNNIQGADLNYPIVAFHPDKPELTIAYEFRDIIYLRKVNLTSFESLEQSVPIDIERIYDLVYFNDFDYIMSASNDAFSDLIHYASKGRSYEKITEDIFDDLDLEYISIGDTKGVLFKSNRPNPNLVTTSQDSIVPILDFDLFFLSYDGDTFGSITQLTNTDEGNEKQAQLVADNIITYLSDQKGVYNRYSIDPIEGVRATNSNFKKSINQSAGALHSDSYLFSYHHKDVPELYLTDIDYSKEVALDSTNLNTKSVESILIAPKQEERPEEIPLGIQFQSQFKEPSEFKHSTYEEQSSLNLFQFDEVASKDPYDDTVDEPFINARAVASRTTFKLEDFAVRADNEVLFDGLQSYTDDQNQLANQIPGILFKGVAADLFEDYRVEGGLRIPTNLKGVEGYLVYDNNKYFLDRRVAFYYRRRTENVGSNGFVDTKQRAETWLGLYRLKYPLDIYTSIRATGQLRLDRSSYLKNDDITSATPNISDKRISLKLDFVFDNTLKVDQYTLNGTRAKIYTEFINNFNLEFGSNTNFDPSTGNTFLVGFDARHYVPFLKHAVLALRGAGATSFGKNRMLYFLGGVENALNPSYNQNISVPPGRTFAYEAAAPHLRGFQTNIRNGSTFLLSNTEVRIPIFRYLSQQQLRSKLFRDFKLVGFFDMGTAFFGSSPTSEENTINSDQISTPPLVFVDLQYFKDPLIFGFGFGGRVSLLGYYIRMDYGWGLESGRVGDPRFYISLGKDF